MDEAKRRELERAGFKVGDIQALLKLSDEDMEVIGLRLVCHRTLKALREVIVERDEAKEVIGQLGETIKNLLGGTAQAKVDELGSLLENATKSIRTLLEERDKARAQLATATRRLNTILGKL